MNAIRLFTVIIYIYFSLMTVHAQECTVSSQGKISYKVTAENNSFTIRYTASSEDANLLIAFPFKQTLPNDYTISWNIISSGAKPGYYIFLKDQSGDIWKGMKRLTIPSKGTGSISKVHFRRPSDQGFDAPPAVDSLYISVSVSKNRKGSFTFSKFHLEEEYLTAKRELMPVIRATSGDDIAAVLMDQDSATFHTFKPGKNRLHLNFHNPRSPGALVIRRGENTELTITVYSVNRKKKKLLAEIAGSKRSYIYIPLPEQESAEYIVEFLSKYAFNLSEVNLLPEVVNDHPVHLHRILSEAGQAGFYPRGFSSTPSPKTSLWKNGGKAVYINQDAQIELPHSGLIIDPFLRILDETGTYLSAKNTVRYSPDSSRVYHVNRAYPLGELWVRAFVDTINKIPYLNLIYEAANLYHFKIKGKVFLTIRPISCNPYSADEMRSLYEPGIFSAIMKNFALTINRSRKVYCITAPQSVGGYSFLRDEYISALSGGDSFPALPLTDKQGLGSIILSYDFTLIPASRRLIFLSIPLENEKAELADSLLNLEQRLRQYLP